MLSKRRYSWKSATLREILWRFLLGGFLLPDGLSADGLSDSVGHGGCGVTAEGLREVQLPKWTHPKTLLLHCQFTLNSPFIQLTSWQSVNFSIRPPPIRLWWETFGIYSVQLLFTFQIVFLHLTLKFVGCFLFFSIVHILIVSCFTTDKLRRSEGEGSLFYLLGHIEETCQQCSTT